MTTSQDITTKLAVSACLIGQKCNFNGLDLFDEFINQLKSSDKITIKSFCPENEIFGTPRANLRIVGGDGYDVLDEKAKVIDSNEKDVTESHMRGAILFLSFLRSENIEAAILMEGSPSCGSNMLLGEVDWPRGPFKAGVGVSTALLRRNGITVLSSFDKKSIGEFCSKIDPSIKFKDTLKDLKDNPNYTHLF